MRDNDEALHGVENVVDAHIFVGLVRQVQYAGPVGHAIAQAPDAVRARIQQEKGPFLKTLEQLVSIESGSSDMEGVARIGDLIANRLRELGGEVEQVAPPADMLRFENTPPQVGKTVVARFRGTGTKRILLLAHMDTVYLRGMLKQQPFRIDGERAYGLGVADDKHGVALILHTISTLKALDFKGFGLITVLINSDEEAGSVSIQMLGACKGCPLSQLDFAYAIESLIRREVPEVREIVAV